MKETRQDAWTKEEDQLLAETVLQYIKNGNTQLEAFKSVADKLVRTPAACGFRWNASLRKQYVAAIKQAREERKKVSSQALQVLQSENDNDTRVIESAIQLLERMRLDHPAKQEVEYNRNQERLITQLQTENSQLKEEMERYKNAWLEMEKLWKWVTADKGS